MDEKAFLGDVPIRLKIYLETNINIEYYKRIQEAMEIPSQGIGSPIMNLLEKTFDEMLRLERDITRRVYFVPRVDEYGSSTNSYRSGGVYKLPATLNQLVFRCT